MRVNELDRDETKLIAPRALRTYVEGLGWKIVPAVNGGISAYSSPQDPRRQILVPLDDRLDDYGDRTAETVARLATFEGRPVREILHDLLSPPADVLSFRIVSQETETGDIALDFGESVIQGTKKGLLAVAHSVTNPQPYHPILSRDDARKFLSRCRMRTGRGSFLLSISCLLDQVPLLPGVDEVPFARRVTQLFFETLNKLSQAPRQGDAGHLADTAKTPGLSANLCEALLYLRPTGERSFLSVTASWSRAQLPPNLKPVEEVRLDQEVFDLAEALAPRLRTRPDPRADVYVGFVEELRGTTTAQSSKPAGEVRLTLQTEDEEVKAKADLSPGDYALAGKAHLNHSPVVMRGILHREPRVSRLESVSQFQVIQLQTNPNH